MGGDLVGSSIFAEVKLVLARVFSHQVGFYAVGRGTTASRSKPGSDTWHSPGTELQCHCQPKVAAYLRVLVGCKSAILHCIIFKS